jgi:hypothetical protein
MSGAISRRRVGAFIEQRMGRSTPCEQLLGAQPVAPGDLRHGSVRLQALLHDARLVVARPPPPLPGARDQLDPPHIRDAVAGLIGGAFKLTLKLIVKMIAHGLALRHEPSPAEMWGRSPAYDQAAGDMPPAVLAELRLLSSARLDSHILLTIVLAGDGRLIERLRSEELLPLGSRMRVRLALERATPEELRESL